MVKNKNVSGYGQGGVDVVMSVDQVAKEAAAISATAPKSKELEKLSKNEPLLSIKNLRAGYGKMEILHDFNLFIGKGQSLCLIGPNGAGKTTTTRAITGLLDVHEGKATKGTVPLDGMRIDNMEPSEVVKSGITQVMEGRRVFSELTVDENLVTGGITSNDRTVIAEAHDRVMAMFPLLAERRNSTAGYLSGGEQQMLAIGRALMSSPKLLILDEPSLGLAPKLVAQIRDIIVEINQSGTSVLLIEQNANMALSIADYGYIMETGKIVMDGEASKLLKDEDVQEFYLGLHGDEGERKSFKDVKHYKRRKRWLS